MALAFAGTKVLPESVEGNGAGGKKKKEERMK